MQPTFTAEMEGKGRLPLIHKFTPYPQGPGI